MEQAPPSRFCSSHFSVPIASLITSWMRHLPHIHSKLQERLFDSADLIFNAIEFMLPMRRVEAPCLCPEDYQLQGIEVWVVQVSARLHSVTPPLSPGLLPALGHSFESVFEPARLRLAQSNSPEFVKSYRMSFEHITKRREASPLTCRWKILLPSRVTVSLAPLRRESNTSRCGSGESSSRDLHKQFGAMSQLLVSDRFRINDQWSLKTGECTWVQLCPHRRSSLEQSSG